MKAAAILAIIAALLTGCSDSGTVIVKGQTAQVTCV